MITYEDVAAASAITEGAMLGVTLQNGTTVCLFRLRGEVGAMGDECTHAQFQLSDGVLHSDGTVECIWHGARFDCYTGEVRRHPATEPVPVYAVKMDGDRVFVAIEAHQGNA